MLIIVGGVFGNSMRRIEFNYSFVVFLYAYLAQIDLSLDRSRWTPIKELQDFYKDQISPQKLAMYLLEFAHIDIQQTKYLCFIGKMTFKQKIVSIYYRFFLQRVPFKTKEIIYCAQKLLLLDEYLRADTEIHKLEIEKLRIEFSQFTFGIIKFHLWPKDREEASKVDHYLQNPILETHPIHYFSKGVNLDWAN